jgi:hypothetical protein
MKQPSLVSQLKSLREIEPRKEWVVFTKQRIFAGEPEAAKAGLASIFPIFRYKLAFAPIISALILIGIFGFTQNTLPGDFLFSVKKMTESAQVAFSSGADKPKTQLKLTNKRLEELSKIAGANQIKNLDPAIKEFKSNITEAAKNLAAYNISATGTDPLIVKEIVMESKRLEENKEKIESVLGAVIGDTNELSSAISQLEKQTAAYLIADLEARTLSENDGLLLNEARADFASGNFATSLEKIWILSNK